jgi:5-formyltetrahydrofolate cyclo-ligase
VSGGEGDKEPLRAQMREVRASIDPEERARMVRAVEEQLAALPEFAAAGTVLLFYSFGSEVGTSGVARRVLGDGKRLLLPFLADEGMEAAEVVLGDELSPTAYGPREPARRVAVNPRKVDLVVTPGLAFDRRGRRLGYGGGHYDRYLARLRPDAVRVGIGFSVQVVDEVPAGPADQRVHLVVTDAEVIDCRTDDGPETAGGPL